MTGLATTEPPDFTGDDWAREPQRLRDLRGRDRGLALGLLVFVLVPFVVAIVRAFHDGWVPSGDESNIATRSLDVFSRHPPLTGLATTSSTYGHGIATNHPGPIEFYLLAIPLRALGATTGLILSAAAINAGFALIALWVFFRRLGLTAMLWAGALMLAVILSAGTAVLTDTLSSNMTMYSLLCTAVLVWGLVDGDLRLLPLTAFVASYAAQQHLAAGLIVLVLLILAAVSLGVHVVRRRRRGDTELVRQARTWGSGAAIVLGVCWLPVLYDEVAGRPGNLTAIVNFARDNTRPTMGFYSAIDQTARAISPPTVLARTDTTGLFFLNGLGWFRAAIGILMIVVLGLIVWSFRKRSRSLSRLALVALVLLAAGFVNGYNIPLSTESWRVNLYRWSWAEALIGWAAIGIALAFIVRRVVGTRPAARRVARGVPIALLLVTALIATTTILQNGKDDHNREQPAFALEKRTATAMFDRIDRHRPVLIIVDGYSATLSVGPYLAFRLVQSGIPVQVQPFTTQTLGNFRRYEPGTRPQAVVVTSGVKRLPAAPGELVASDHFSPERSRLLDELAAEAKGKHAVLAPGAQKAIDAQYPVVGAYVPAALERLPTGPRTVLEQPLILELFLDGLIRSPALDRTKVRRLLGLPAYGNAIGGDEDVDLHYLTPAQVPVEAKPYVSP